jgi:hypothetical protein
MQLVPAVIGVENPCARQPNLITDTRCGQTPAIARHKFDDEVPACL